MKYLKCVLPIFTVFLFIGCTPDSKDQEEAQESRIEEPQDSKTDTIQDSNILIDETTEIEREAESNVEAQRGAETKGEPKEPNETAEKKMKDVSINRNVGVKLKAENEFDLMGFAAQEVALLRKEECEGQNCGKRIQLQNFNSEKQIVTVVMIKWKKKDVKQSELREYKVKAESVLDLGCSSSCDAIDGKYTWKIVSAKYY